MATQVTNSMVSEVSICNQALAWLGQKSITSLDQLSVNAEWMANNYPFIRDALVESRAWTFATVRSYSTTANRDPWDTKYSHVAPVGWLRILGVWTGPQYYNSSTPSEEWSLESGYLLTDSATVYMMGIARVTDTGKFSSLFVQALAARIAADACIPFTTNRQLQADLWTLSIEKLAEAAAVDGMQGRAQKTTSHTLVNARYGGRGS